MDLISKSQEELDHLLKKTFTGFFRSGYITKNDFVLPERYLVLEKDINEFEVFDNDVWICGFPKTGTTWISEIVWLIMHGFDYEGAKENAYKRTIMLELDMLFDIDDEILLGNERLELKSIDNAKNQKKPRTIKSHLPFPLLPKQIIEKSRKPKIICTTRNPMDTCVSYYYQCKNFEGFRGTFEEFTKLFLFDKINYGPYASHVLSFWKQRTEPNMLHLTYEEMKSDLPRAIGEVAKFLEKPISKEDSLRLQDHVSFQSMQKNPAVNRENMTKHLEVLLGTSLTPFIRTGLIGGYKSMMKPEVIEEFRQKMGEKFKDSGLNILD